MQKKIVFWSDGAERITGHLRHEVIGHSCISESLLHCDQPGCEFCKEDCPVARAIKTSHPAEGIGFLHHKAGYENPVRIPRLCITPRLDYWRGGILKAGPPPASIIRETMSLPGCIDKSPTSPARR
jgi:hypothetical protein